ncbi:MAG: hypothetical protein AAB795_03560 [Patescibacteria group bacterium]
MKKLFVIIKSSDAVIRIQSIRQSDIDRIKCSKFLRRYIPQFEILNSKHKFNCNLKIAHSNNKTIFLKYPTAKYFAQLYNDKDLISFAEFLLERARQELGIYCIHSSAVVINGKGIIFWGGASGMGKTRLALKISTLKNCSFYSDEKTLLDLQGNVMCGGIYTAYLSKPHFQKNHGEKSFLEYKRASESVPIKLFIYPYVEEESKKLIIERWSSEKFNWHLYEELSRKIRGTSRRMFANTIPLSSLDTQKLSEERSRSIKKYTKKIPCYFLKGSESAIIKTIFKLIEK